MVALPLDVDTVPDMTPRRPAVATIRSSRQHGPHECADVLDSVAGALRAGAGGDDWALLEAWVSALTLVTWAALQAVPEELHDFL